MGFFDKLEESKLEAILRLVFYVITNYAISLLFISSKQTNNESQQHH